MSASITKLVSLGQSLWLDNIERQLLDNGELAKLIDRWKISGITSNPSIFEKAIAGSNAYDAEVSELLNKGIDKPDHIIDALMVRDIQQAADLLHPVFQRTQGIDGMVSIEVSPELAHDTEGTIAHGIQLHDRIHRPNLMIKVPATLAGLPAIKALIAQGINVNVTLLFSTERYLAVLDAYLAGLEQRLEQGLDISHLRSVASFFVSRVDAIIDPQLAAVSDEHPLLGKIAIANCHNALQAQHQALQSERFQHIQAKGGNMQRLLWASTSTKNPKYSDVLYVEQLVQPHTVNTVPPTTIEAFEDHGHAEGIMEHCSHEYAHMLDELEHCDINLKAALTKLEEDGVAAFQQAFCNLKAVIEEKIKRLQTLSA